MTRAAIKHGEERLRQAMLASDVAALDALCHASLLFQLPDASLIRKEDDLAIHRAGRQTLARLETTDLVVELHGDDVAVATMLVALEGTFDGHPVEGRFRAIRTWRRNHRGEWQIIAGAITPLAAR